MRISQIIFFKSVDNMIKFTNMLYIRVQDETIYTK